MNILYINFDYKQFYKECDTIELLSLKDKNKDDYLSHIFNMAAKYDKIVFHNIGEVVDIYFQHIVPNKKYKSLLLSLIRIFINKINPYEDATMFETMLAFKTIFLEDEKVYKKVVKKFPSMTNYKYLTNNLYILKEKLYSIDDIKNQLQLTTYDIVDFLNIKVL